MSDGGTPNLEALLVKQVINLVDPIAEEIKHDANTKDGIELRIHLYNVVQDALRLRAETLQELLKRQRK